MLEVWDLAHGLIIFWWGRTSLLVDPPSSFLKLDYLRHSLIINPILASNSWSLASAFQMHVPPLLTHFFVLFKLTLFLTDIEKQTNYTHYMMVMVQCCNHCVICLNMPSKIDHFFIANMLKIPSSSFLRCIVCKHYLVMPPCNSTLELFTHV